MMQLHSDFTAHTSPDHLGALLRWLRDRHGLAQALVVAHLPATIDQQRYSSFERNTRSPAFDELPVMYQALKEAGVRLSLRDRDLFLGLAKQQLESKRTHKVQKSPHEWDNLRAQLALIDQLPDAPFPLSRTSSLRSAPSSRMEISHLVGRERWLDSLYVAITGQPPMKWLMLQGPPGIGKTSELHRIASYFQQHLPRYYVVLCQLPEREQETISPDLALELLLSAILEGIGPANAPMPMGSLQARVKYVLGCVARADRAVLILLDNAEHLLDEQGQLTPVWKNFYEQFVHMRHHASLIGATKEWPSWLTLEAQWAGHSQVPLLLQEEGILLLRRLGLGDLSEEQLGQVVEVVGGVPLCLEWTAKLVKEPLLQEGWAAFDDEGSDAEALPDQEKSRRLAQLLEDPALFRGPVQARVVPLLERLLRRLSPDALAALQGLALATVPLGTPALKLLYPGPLPLQELRDASLLVASPRRVQVLPMVAASVQARLSTNRRVVLEEQLATALFHWLTTSHALDNREMGMISGAIAEIALKHHRLLDAAQFMIRYGWLSFRLGHARKLAHVAMQSIEEVRRQTNGQIDVQQQCGSMLLINFLAPFLGQKLDAQERLREYHMVWQAMMDEVIALEPPIEVAVTHHLMHASIHQLRFEEALASLESCCDRLQAHMEGNPDLTASLLEKRAWLFGRWGEYAEETGNQVRADKLAEQTIALNRQIVALLSNAQERSSLEQAFLKKRLARALNNLGYHLNRIGEYEHARRAMEQSISLKERGYAEIDTMADANGEQAQILVGLGRFQEALYYDEKAFGEVQRLAEAGFAFAQADLPTYQVNRGCLYLRLGRIDEAEALLREAEPRVQPERRMYRVFAQQALREIEQWWASRSGASHYQLDWRWVERYRQLASFDSYWWWTPAGPFNEEEQQQWDQLFAPDMDDEAKERLGALMAVAREREFAAALGEQREPRFCYPALAIDEVRDRLAGLARLDAEINREEPNAIVRRLYRETIQEELDFLRMIEATYEGNAECYWECSLRFTPPPTRKEMEYALSRATYYVRQGLAQSDTGEASQRALQAFQHIGLSLDVSIAGPAVHESSNGLALSSGPRRLVTALTARRFYEAALHGAGYAEWEVTIDPNASVPRIEQGLRRIFLPPNRISLQQIKSDLSHELAGHVARCIAGERSLLGLLGIHTAHSLEMEEGLATYYEMREASQAGQPYDETGTWFGTLAVGLAGGVLAPPQTFLSVFHVFEAFIYLYRLLRRPDQDNETAQKFARKLALARCIRTFRGVPALERAGVCYTKDALYVRGLWKLEHEVARDQGILDRLAVGVVALEQLPELAELGIVSAPQPLRYLAQRPDLDAYILSFEAEEGKEQEVQRG